MVGKNISRTALIAAAVFCASPVWAQIQITEFMYDGVNSGEFSEITNRGPAPVDLTGWTWDDSGDTVGNIDLSSAGMVAPGESVVIGQVPTGGDATTFRTTWGLPVTVKVITYVGGQLQRNDTINVRDAGSNLVATLVYGDSVNVPGSIRTQNFSGWPCGEVVGQSPINSSWNLASVGDAQGSVTSADGNVGSPGSYTHFLCLCGNDTVDANEECDGSEVANCPSGICNADCTCQAAPVPTVSEWGLLVLTLIGLTAGTLMFNRLKTVKA